MTDRETIDRFLAAPDTTPEERAVILWQYQLIGDFKQALWEAISRADGDNLLRLELGFPDEVRGFRGWAHGDMATRLRNRGLEI